MPGPPRRPVRQVFFPKLEEFAAANEGFAKVYTHWKAFRDLSLSWTSTAEYAHARGAAR